MSAPASPLRPAPGRGAPPLRQELRIEPGAPLIGGAPSWTMFDPLRHSFFQLGGLEFTVLSNWARGNLHQAADQLVASGLSLEAANAEVARVVDFSLANHLTVTPSEGTVPQFELHRRRQDREWWRWLIDHYLFFRVPLVRPGSFLKRTLPRVSPIWSPIALWFFVALAATGLLMVSRQWDAFLASFLYFFSWQGLIAYGLGLSVVKVAHELGHAYTATRFGCSVPAMGVSFLVMMPVLYTDTTGAWRLTSRRKRLIVDCAGVSAELMIASVATFAWALLPEGPFRSVAFILATTSWVMSLAINLNPFMRFDGYYVLSDVLGVPNLQPRSFALGRWRLRELLFKLGEGPPELMPASMQRMLILYAWATWIYRLVLFIGIALLVYHLFFKLLGIILFVVEMAVFVVRPVFAELREWHARRSRLAISPRGRALLAGLCIGVVLGFLPLDRHVNVPAVLGPIVAAPVVAGDPARVDRILVREGQRVRAGAAIAELIALDVEAGAERTGIRLSGLEEQLSRAPADKEDLSARMVIEREIGAERNALAGFERRRDRLILRSPVDGIATSLDRQMHPGRWLGGSEVLVRIVTPRDYDVQAYIGESEVDRIRPGALARFIPDDPIIASRAAKLQETSSSAITDLSEPMLASVYGGPIAVNQDESKKLRPREALYRLRFVAEPGEGALYPLRGTLNVEAESRSVFGQLFGSFARILRAEASLAGE